MQHSVIVSKEFLEGLRKDMDEIKAMLRPTKSQPLNNDLRTPSEVCNHLKISRTKFDRLCKDGYLELLRPYGKGKKVYVSAQQLANLFPKDYANQL